MACQAWLVVMASLAAQVANESSQGLALPYDPGLGAPLLRGQRNADWPLSPTGHRLSGDKQTLAGHALAVFTVTMLELFAPDGNPMNSPYAHIARALVGCWAFCLRLRPATALSTV
jgi:hypothetical protein